MADMPLTIAFGIFNEPFWIETWVMAFCPYIIINVVITLYVNTHKLICAYEVRDARNSQLLLPTAERLFWILVAWISTPAREREVVI